MAEWYCRVNGTSCNPAWLTIARRVGCQPGAVAAVYDAICEEANKSTPRGSVDGFVAQDYAEFSGFDEAIVSSVFEQLEARGFIRDGRMANAEVLYPERKKDRTNAERQARHRARKGRKVTDSNGVTSTASESNAVTSRVTPLERESEAISLVGNASSSSSSCSVGNSESKSNSTPARALSVEQIEQKLKAVGALGGVLAGLRRPALLTGWVAKGVTDAQLDAAIAIGQQRRAAAHSNKPLNPGLLDSILSDLAQVSSQPSGSRPNPSPPRTESALDQAVAFVKHLRHLGQIDEAEAEKRIQEARARHARSAA